VYVVTRGAELAIAAKEISAHFPTALAALSVALAFALQRSIEDQQAESPVQTQELSAMQCIG
jgi:hypothetical protein